MIKRSGQDQYTSIAALSPLGSWNLNLLQIVQAFKTLAHQWQSKATYWPLEIIGLEMMIVKKVFQSDCYDCNPVVGIDKEWVVVSRNFNDVQFF